MKKNLKPIIKESPYYKATSNDIDWVAKVHMQGAVQKWVDHSISVTVNVPNDTREEMVADIYQTAWKSGCKGMTVYRDGSREGVLVNNDKKDDADTADEFQRNPCTSPSRPAGSRNCPFSE
jgi:ribonucleoside-diphosphate reductase alpha chain